MYLHNFCALICVLYSAQVYIGEANGYPMLQLPRLFGSYESGARYNKRDVAIPQVDADELELEHLKTDGEQQHQHKSSETEIPSTVVVGGGGIAKPAINHSDSIPQLEHQLEIAVQNQLTTTTAAPTADDESESAKPEKEIAQVEHGIHRPPMLPHNDGGKLNASGNQQHHTDDSVHGSGTAGIALTKPFYGAARLAFGQNPEVLPTTSTSTSSTTSTPIPTTNNNEPIVNAPAAAETNTDPLIKSPMTTSSFAIPTTGTIATDQQIPTNLQSEIDLEQQDLNTKDKPVLDNTKEIASDAIATDLDATKSAAQRRSIPFLMPKTPENMLRHSDGQYSSFDMAQYVFWTGDEAGVARAVEEFIEQGLMTREHALKFLRDIRLGIEYLQRSYANRVFPEEIHQNNVKKSFVIPPPMQPMPQKPSTTTSTTTTTTTTEKPYSYLHLEPELIGTQANAQLVKNLESISLLHKLQELSNDGRQELTDYDEATGRAKIAEFLYTEYTLEEILYKLAKVMFTQSLAHGSDEAQRELQKLTNFLEREGNIGVIPIDLQKKVLHVLLTALSDTLNEHPELLPAARLNLVKPYNTLPMHTYGTLN